MKLKSAIKGSLFARSFQLAKSNPNKIGLMILFDISFFLSFYYILPALAEYFKRSLIISQTMAFLLLIAILSLIYYLIVLFIYSFFKYSVLDFTKSLFGKTPFSFNRLGQFYLLNLIIIMPPYIIFSTILDSIKEAFRPFVLLALGIPLFLFLYTVINVSHSFFNQGDSIKKSIHKSFNVAFTKIKNYRETISIIIFFALALGILFLGGGYLIQLIASKNYNLYLITYAYLRQASIVIFDLAFYFIILINRISFYSIAREMK